MTNTNWDSASKHAHDVEHSASKAAEKHLADQKVVQDKAAADFEASNWDADGNYLNREFHRTYDGCGEGKDADGNYAHSGIPGVDGGQVTAQFPKGKRHERRGHHSGSFYSGSYYSASHGIYNSGSHHYDDHYSGSYDGMHSRITEEVDRAVAEAISHSITQAVEKALAQAVAKSGSHCDDDHHKGRRHHRGHGHYSGSYSGGNA